MEKFSKAFVEVSDNRNVIDSTRVAYKALLTFMRDQATAQGTVLAALGSQYREPVCTYCADTAIMKLSFLWKGLDRTLWMFFDCDRDYRHLSESPKVVFNLGDGGDSIDILIHVAAAFAQQGKKAWLTSNALAQRGFVTLEQAYEITARNAAADAQKTLAFESV